MPFSFSRADTALLQGVIDMHLHTMPCLFDRPLDDIEAAEQAREAGYRGLVLKSIYSPNADRVELVRRVVPGIELFGTIVLNHSVGGLNPEAVRTAIGFGAKVMWLPTVHAQHHFDHFGMPTYPWLGQRVGALPQATVPGIRLLDAEGGLKAEVAEILALAKAADLVTGTGHIGLDEVYAVAREARRIGYEKLVQTHVGWHATDWPLEDLTALADLGTRFEFCINPTMPNRQQQSPRKLTDTIKALGIERCFIATDLGQHDNAHPIEGMRMWLRILALHGFSAGEIDHLARLHPAMLLDLPPSAPAAGGLTATPMPPTVSLVLRPDRMLDGTGARLPAGAALAIAGDRIAAMLPPGAPDPEGAKIVDLPPGCTLLPGLIDLHDYLSVDPDRPHPMAQMFGADLAARRDIARRHMWRDLLSGVTTQRVMGEGDGLDLALAADVAACVLPGPSLVCTGAPIAPSGSHQQRPTGGIDTEAALSAEIEAAAERGQGWIKLVATGGVNGSGLGPTERGYSAALLRHAIARAHASGLRVAVAAQGGPAVIDAAEAGAESIEHGALLDAACVAALAANGTAWVLTPGRFLRPDGIPRAAARDAGVAARLAPVRPAMASAVPLAVKLGVRLGLGADNMHGRFADDVAQLIGLGAPGEVAIAAATGMAAAILGLSDRGGLAAGQRADLLVVDGDPLAAADALQRVRAVFTAGRAYVLGQAA